MSHNCNHKTYIYSIEVMTDQHGLYHQNERATYDTSHQSDETDYYSQSCGINQPHCTDK